MPIDKLRPLLVVLIWGVQLWGRSPELRADSLPGEVEILNIAYAGDTVNIFTGLELLEHTAFQALNGASVALLANSGSTTRDGRHIFDVFKDKYPGKIKAFIWVNDSETGANFSLSQSEGKIDSAAKFTFLDANNYQLTSEMLNEASILVIDLQDNGWGFSSSLPILIEVLQYSSQHGLPLILLDRPNPVGAQKVEGPLMRVQGVTAGKLPIRPGLTIGELALLLTGEKWLGATAPKLKIVKMLHYLRRQDLSDWRAARVPVRIPGTSRDCNYLYGGQQLVKATNLSFGEGTDLLYEIVGAPWLSGAKLAELLNSAKLPGVTFYPYEFTPHKGLDEQKAPRYAGENCSGVQIRILNWQTFESVQTALTLIYLVGQLYPHRFRWEALDDLAPLEDSAEIQAVISYGGDLRAYLATVQASLSNYQRIRLRYLMY